VLVDRQNMVLWQDLNDLSKANLAAVQVQGQPVNAPVMAKAPDGGKLPGDTDTKPTGESPNNDRGVKVSAPKPLAQSPAPKADG